MGARFGGEWMDGGDGRRSVRLGCIYLYLVLCAWGVLDWADAMRVCEDCFQLLW